MDNLEPIYIKKDNNTLEVTKPEIIVPVVTIYSMESLLIREQNIVQKMKEFCDARDAELADIRSLIEKAQELGLKTQAEIEEQKKDDLENTTSEGDDTPIATSNKD